MFNIHLLFLNVVYIVGLKILFLLNIFPYLFLNCLLLCSCAPPLVGDHLTDILKMTPLWFHSLIVCYNNNCVW